MMKWRPWQPLLISRKMEVGIVVNRVEGLNSGESGGEKEVRRRFVVRINWTGQKSVGLSSLKRSIRRNITEEGECSGDGIVEWNEEFSTLCSFSSYKDGVFLPWEVVFTVFNSLNHDPRNKTSIVGTASLNLAVFASSTEEKEVKVPLVVPGSNIKACPILLLSLRLTDQESPKPTRRLVLPVLLSPCSPRAFAAEESKEGLRKVKLFTSCVSYQGAKNETTVHHHKEVSGRRSFDGGEDPEYNYPFDTDSLDDAEGESEESSEGSSGQSISYKTLAHANWFGGSLHSSMNCKDESWIYYSSHRNDLRFHVENSDAAILDQSSQEGSKRRILSWKKRQLSFRSTKPKGEPLLRKDYREEGGDDIDFDRRQLGSSDESSFGWYKSDGSTTTRTSDSEFGDDNFAVGSWEMKEIISRDGLMKLRAQVFFASIDQRSERAAGESACTVLVAVIANWLQSNRDEMPIKSEFDSLIRLGSLAWRNLCKNEDYRERFLDKHFDLETVIEAKIRPLTVVPEKSFIGFFHPEGSEDGGFDFLHSAMSFDSIWDELSHQESELESNIQPLVYIVSWNDHFFILKVEKDAYYIIDTLGERLYEGCNQAYVLKFDKDTVIEQIPNNNSNSSNENSNDKKPDASKNIVNEGAPDLALKSETSANSVVVCRGKVSCKEYIKSFLAAIPIRELQADMKKGLKGSVLHHRLQIEFHYAQFLQPAIDCAIEEAER